MQGEVEPRGAWLLFSLCLFVPGLEVLQKGKERATCIQGEPNWTIPHSLCCRRGHAFNFGLSP